MLASKFALEGWAETLRLEMKPLGVQVVLVEPGSFETDIWTRNASSPPRRKTRIRRMPPALGLLKSREAGKLKANPQKVADGIAAILDDPHPRLRYVFGRDAHLGLRSSGFCPRSMLEWLLIKVSGIGV